MFQIYFQIHATTCRSTSVVHFKTYLIVFPILIFSFSRVFVFLFFLHVTYTMFCALPSPLFSRPIYLRRFMADPQLPHFLHSNMSTPGSFQNQNHHALSLHTQFYHLGRRVVWTDVFDPSY